MIEAGEYAKEFSDMTDNDIDKNLIFIISSSGEIKSTIERNGSIDAKGNVIPTSYKIVGDTIYESIELDEVSSFPVISKLASNPPKTRIKKLRFNNNSTGHAALRKFSDDLRSRSNSSGTTMRNIINSIFGLLGLGSGILSIMVSYQLGSEAAYLDDLKDKVIHILNEFLREKRYAYAEFVFHEYGTYQGKNKGYVYKITKTDLIML